MYRTYDYYIQNNWKYNNHINQLNEVEKSVKALDDMLTSQENLNNPWFHIYNDWVIVFVEELKYAKAKSDYIESGLRIQPEYRPIAACGYSMVHSNHNRTF